jgi:hypothetical protein
VPNSFTLFGPFGVVSKRTVFNRPTEILAALNKSGLSVIALPIKIPPALPLEIPIYLGLVYFSFIIYSGSFGKEIDFT